MTPGDISSQGQSPSSKRVLITGANGQVGWELQRTAPEGVEVIALDSAALDIRDQAQVNKIFNELTPDVVINAAAYTSVDKAEKEPEIAYAVNATGAGNLAKASYSQDARFIQISTDFVFDGKQSTPYLPDDLPNPLGVYGASKLKGEQLVSEYTHGEAIIIRTAWVYSSHGENFVKTMLRLMRERNALSVVVDQIGSPTWANGLAQTIWKMTKQPKIRGIFHWTDAGVASWYDFSVAIQDEAIKLGLLKRNAIVSPIPVSDYITIAPRPVYSVLGKTKVWEGFGVRSEYWQHSLSRMLTELRYNENDKNR